VKTHSTSSFVGQLLGRRGVGLVSFGVAIFAGIVFGFGESLETLLATVTLGVAGLLTVVYTYRVAQFPSLRVAVPLFYLAVFLLIPIAQQLLGVADFMVLPGFSGALLLVTLGVVSFGLAVFACEATVGRGAKPQVPISERWPLKQCASPVGALVLFVVGFGAELWSLHFGYFGLLVVEAERQSSAAGMIGVITSLIDVVCIISIHKTFKADSANRKIWIFLFAASFLALLYGGVLSNSKWGVIKPVAYVGIAMAATRQRLPIALLGAFVGGYILIAYPFISSLREFTQSRSFSATDVLVESPAFFFRMEWADQFRGDARTDSFSEAFGSLGRGLMPVLAHVMDTVGDEHPYMEGETYRLAFETTVPRFLWKDKPDLSIGNVIGQHFSVVHPNDNITNISPSQIGELFINFGFFGVFIGMFLWGIACWWVDVRVVTSSTSWLATWALFLVIWQEAALGHGPIAFIKSLPVLFLTCAAAASFAMLLSGRRQLQPSA
jgi:hypothetical protein